jgi:hypothetical protein
MMFRTLLICLWASQASAQTGDARLAWDADADPAIFGYLVQVGTSPGGPYHEAVTVARTDGAPTAVVKGLLVGVTYYAVARSIDVLGILSGASNEVAFTLGQLGDCAPITGRYAVSIFPSSLQLTGNGKAGSRARLLFQLASPNAPITFVAVYADGALVSRPQRGEDVTDSPGSWFTVPPRGTYTLSVIATNSQGCTRTVAYGPLVVP